MAATDCTLRRPWTRGSVRLPGPETGGELCIAVPTELFRNSGIPAEVPVPAAGARFDLARLAGSARCRALSSALVEKMFSMALQLFRVRCPATTAGGGAFQQATRRVGTRPLPNNAGCARVPNTPPFDEDYEHGMDAS